jgi:predicted transcriptional regulator
MSCLNGSDVYQGDDVNKLVEILKKESEVSLDELARLSMLSVVQLEDALITLNKSEHVVFS